MPYNDTDNEDVIPLTDICPGDLLVLSGPPIWFLLRIHAVNQEERHIIANDNNGHSMQLHFRVLMSPSRSALVLRRSAVVGAINLLVGKYWRTARAMDNELHPFGIDMASERN